MSSKLSKLRTAIKNEWVKFRYDRGWISKDEVLREQLPEREKMFNRMPLDAATELRAISESMNDIRIAADPTVAFQRMKQFADRANHFVEKYGQTNEALAEVRQKINYVTGVDAIGYRPSGARIWKFFLNPYQVYSFLAEHHPAVYTALEVWDTEVRHDGWRLVPTQKGVTDERIAEVRKQLDALKITDLVLRMVKCDRVYGAHITLPHRNIFGEVIELESLVMDRAEPILDKNTGKLRGWDYKVGLVNVPYRLTDLLYYKRPSLKNPDIGLPPLSCLISDLEADMGGSALNLTMVSKAGMVSVIIALEDPAAARVGNKNLDKELRKLQQEIQLNFSGAAAGGSMMVSNYVKGVHKLSQMQDWDGAFQKFRLETWRSVATVEGVPLSKMNIPQSATIQYQASSFEDQINASFDKRISSLMEGIYGHCNEEVLQGLLGIYDVKMVANGRTSMTLQGARAGKVASDTGGLFDTNEERTLFYGQQPLPEWDPRGREICDNSKNRDAKSSPPRYTARNASEAKKNVQIQPAPEDTNAGGEDPSTAA